MMSSKSWMWSSLGLALLVGICLGVIADELLLSRGKVFADGPRKRPPMWFVCEGSPDDIELEPGYPYPERLRSRLLGGLSEALELDAAQRAALESLLEEKRDGAHAFWERSRVAFCEMRDAFRAEIRVLLDPEQQSKFDEMSEELDRSHLERVRRWQEEALQAAELRSSGAP